MLEPKTLGGFVALIPFTVTANLMLTLNAGVPKGSPGNLDKGLDISAQLKRG